MARALRVVHVYKGYPPVRGGIEGHVDLITRLLARRGIEVEVLCGRPRGTPRQEQRHGVRVRRCATLATLASTPLPPGLPVALRRSPADLVHLHWPWPPASLAWLAGGRSRPLVVTVHCEAVRYPALARLLAPLEGLVLRRAGRIIVSSPALAGLPLLRARAERVVVSPYGIDLERFAPDARVPDPLPDVPRPRIVFVGRLRHYKGLPVLAAALARLPGARLVVVGGGPERARLERALHDHGCRERAHLEGEVDDGRLVRILQTADAAVLASTSRAEAFGLAIVEAQACGVPAVTTDVGTGTTLTVADGESGRIVPPHDARALADALAWCLEPRGAAERRAAARRHALARFPAERMVGDVLRVYEEVAAARSL